MDFAELKKYLNCDDEFLISIIDKFISEVTEISSQIEKAAAEENWKIVRANAHKLLSSIKIFELTDLIIITEKIEINAELKKNIPQLKDDIYLLLENIKTLIPQMKVSLEKLK